MALTRAEIQRNYRERKKAKEGDKYLAKERKRQRNNYIPVALLSNSARKKRNKKINKRVKRHRKKKKERREENQGENASNDVSTSSGYESFGGGTSGEPARLIVRLPSVSARRNGPRKRLSKALSKAHRDLKSLKTENDILRRKVKTIQRRVQRMKTKEAPSTPRRKTDRMLKDAGIKGSKSVRKHLLMSNVIVDEIKKKMRDKKAGKKKVVYGQVVGKLLMKYRCISKVSNETGVHRNLISRCIKEGVNFTKQRRSRTLAKHRDSIIQFLEREDNSRLQPGKNDAVKCGEEKVQTRVLTDYLDNLFLKYQSEHSNISVSLSSFRRARPKYILPTTFLSRNTCLCTKHQNFVFKLKMMKKEGIQVSINPEDYVRQNTSIDVNQLPTEVTFSIWKRVQLPDGKKKMKIVQESMKREEFGIIWEKEEADFKDHVYKIKTQYAELRRLKENLPQKDIILHMDFAENYSCKTADEIQSAYWNQSQITLHPIVLYYNDPSTNSLAHRSYVAVSDCLTHSSSTVLATDAFYGMTVGECDGVDQVHYWTDSPTSQYRNRYIFETVLTHKEKYGSQATWNYFEAGHGKGPCDGVGGTVKRMADEAVNSSRASIQDAEEFMSWAKQSSMKGVHFFYVTKEECERKSEITKKCRLPPVKGTMTLHACKTDMNLLITASTSCYCEFCLMNKYCENWSITTSYPKESGSTIAGASQSGTTTSTNGAVSNVSTCMADVDTDKSHEELEHYELNSFVAAMYEGKWYVGQVMDRDGTEVEVTFMEQKKNFFQWPRTEDKIWVDKADIICEINPLLPSGKSKRMYKMDQSDREKVERLLEQ